MDKHRTERRRLHANEARLERYSQIESRVLLFLAGDTETLEMFRADPDADAYEIHARATMGWDPEKSLNHESTRIDTNGDPSSGNSCVNRRGILPATISATGCLNGETRAENLKDYCDRTGSSLRQLAKARVLGLGFGCGWKRFIEVAQVMAGLNLSDEESKRVVKEFRDSNPKVVDLWARLNDACAACDGGHYVLPLPCMQVNPDLNRYLVYRDVVADKNGIECTVGGDRIYVYGGLLAENWTQATARDVMASAWLRCADSGYVPVMSVHDELVFEVNEATAEAELAEIQRIMETPVGWAQGLPLKTDGKLMRHYKK